jgi:hypothetical protein
MLLAETSRLTAPIAPAGDEQASVEYDSGSADTTPVPNLQNMAVMLGNVPPVTVTSVPPDSLPDAGLRALTVGVSVGGGGRRAMRYSSQHTHLPRR